ncbi:DUF4245 domain-containing protein [Glutamicibacter endophyticus]|uniref:DUF4245 domain-containing protein n=1 Tax=Glutamicibacter endophyticus TaxID=1522174 RepID=UPI003AF141F3
MQQPENQPPTESVDPQRRDLSDPKATYEDLPFKPVLTEKQAKRANQTFKGMVLSILFTVAVAVPILLLNPGPKDDSFKNPVDLQQVATEAAQVAKFQVWAPQLSGDEYANFARWRTNAVQDVSYWEFGLVLSDSKFAWVRQTADANPTWLANITENATPSDKLVLDGTEWEVRTKDDETYLIAELGQSTLVLSSDTGEEELINLARLAQTQLQR